MKQDMCVKVAILSVCLMGIACPNAKAQAVSPTAEAHVAADRLWNLILAHCGDSYYFQFDDGSGFEQYQAPSFPLPIATRISEADRQNGYTWRGWAVVTGKIYRSYSSKNARWDEWQDSAKDSLGSGANNVVLSWRMWKLKGHWHFSQTDIFGSVDEVDLDSMPPKFIHHGALLGDQPPKPMSKMSCAVVPGTKEFAQAQDAEARRAKEADKEQQAVIPLKPEMLIEVSPEESQHLLVIKVPPIYPPLAKVGGVQGTVTLHAVVNKDGRVEEVRLVEGPAMLQQSAIDAVKRWVYNPYLVKGSRVRFETVVDLTFSLNSR